MINLKKNELGFHNFDGLENGKEILIFLLCFMFGVRQIKQIVQYLTVVLLLTRMYRSHL